MQIKNSTHRMFEGSDLAECEVKHNAAVLSEIGANERIRLSCEGGGEFLRLCTFLPDTEKYGGEKFARYLCIGDYVFGMQFAQIGNELLDLLEISKKNRTPMLIEQRELRRNISFFKLFLIDSVIQTGCSFSGKWNKLPLMSLLTDVRDEISDAEVNVTRHHICQKWCPMTPKWDDDVERFVLEVIVSIYDIQDDIEAKMLLWKILLLINSTSSLKLASCLIKDIGISNLLKRRVDWLNGTMNVIDRIGRLIADLGSMQNSIKLSCF